jgi:anti-sigma factor RsiW
VRCEDVRLLLPEVAEGLPHRAGEVDRHLASCAACRADLERYRALLAGLGELREETVDPPPALLGRLLERAPRSRWEALGGRAIPPKRVRRAAYSLGGVAVGAAAVGLLWRRRTRRLAAA